MIVYRLGFELFGLKGAGKVAGIVRGKAGTGGKAGVLAESPAGKTKLANEGSKPSVVDAHNPKSPAELSTLPKDAAAGAKTAEKVPLTVISNKAWFAAGTMMMTPDGWKPIERFLPGDLIASRSEHDPQGIIEAKRVVQVFKRVSLILELWVRGRLIRTTAEHPFYVEGRGWIPAGMLNEGDQLHSHDGSIRTVERLVETNEVTTVYNVEVTDYHTYFVGGPDWNFSVWAHNADCAVIVKEGDKYFLKSKVDGRELAKGTEAKVRDFAKENGHEIHEAPIKGWKSTNALNDLPKQATPKQREAASKANAGRLRNNMGDAVKEGEDAHHIVQSTHKRAEDSRKLLDKYQIDINATENGVGLKPTGERPAHHGQELHSNDAIDIVNKRLQKAVRGVQDWAKARKKLVEELGDIRTEILNGSFP